VFPPPPKGRGFHTEDFDDEDTFAKETDRYSDLEGAIQCLIQDANFELPPQLTLF
jgi:hypothetical protein